MERVGGRRRVRGEIVLLVAGLVFLVAAVVKPWASPPGASPAPSGSALAVVQPSASGPAPGLTTAPPSGARRHERAARTR
ncbi:MAG: hypothetical protein ABSA21_06935 [Candidatus Limnocylindrales bacterium]|jgi:hypothetical protein